MKKIIALVTLALICASHTRAEIPAPEKFLPADTLLLLTAPDLAKTRAQSHQSPQLRFWHDPAMKPFADKFMDRLQTELVGPLEHELGINFSNYTALAQGQITLAIVQNGWQGTTNPLPSWLLLLDTKTNSALLKTNLADLKRKWTDANKPLKTEKIRDIEFTILLVSTNDLPATLKNLNAAPNTFTADDAPKSTPPTPTTELYLGQYESLLIAGGSPKVIERALLSLGGSQTPVLADEPAFEASRAALFRDSGFYGWANTKTIFEILTKILSAKSEEDADKPSLLPIRPEKAIAALGLNALRTLAFSAQSTPEGSTAQCILTVPEAERQGLFKILAGNPKPTTPPNFIPADAVKFTRCRLDGRKTWETLEQTLKDISPQLATYLDFALTAAGAQAKEKDSTFDLKKNLLDSIGDDFISYQKAPRSKALTDIVAPPSIFLAASPKPEKLLDTLKSLFALVNRRGDEPTERDFLGHKIYIILAPPAKLVNGEKTGTRATSFSTANGYVAISMDPATLEEFLRGETSGKPLRETPGLADATQRIAGDSATLLTYENQRETMRAAFDIYKQLGNTNSAAAADPFGIFGIFGGQKFFKDWADVSLLPEYDKVAKYFGFSVSAMSTTPTGLSLKMFAPTPAEIPARPTN